MSLQIKVFCAGPLQNNVILIFDDSSKECFLFDPSFGIEEILRILDQEKLKVKAVLFTHGHFDHFAGLSYLLSKLPTEPEIGLHADDLAIWRDGGGSRQFRALIEPPCDPNITLKDGQHLILGKSEIEIRHTPGHSPGSVIYYVPDLNTAIVGDLIFHRGVGRTDLDGGSFKSLKESVHSRVFTLPPETILIPGHGPNTTVAEEMEYNPYVGVHSDLSLDEQDFSD